MSGEKKFNKAEYDLKFDKKNCTKFGLKFNNINDKEIIEKLHSIGNKNDYIRQLILADIQKTKENQNL